MRFAASPNPLDAYALEQHVDITFGNEAATLRDLVELKSEPVAGAQVVLIPSGVTGAARYASQRRVTTEADGRWEVRALPPGEYRVLAVPGEAAERLEDGLVLDSLLQRAKKVTLTRASEATLKLEVLTGW